MTLEISAKKRQAEDMGGGVHPRKAPESLA